jgi:hypothetical protein
METLCLIGNLQFHAPVIKRRVEAMQRHAISWKSQKKLFRIKPPTEAIKERYRELFDIAASLCLFLWRN